MDTGGQRTLRTVSELRAFAHPLRMAIYELLASGEPLTATELGRRLGQEAAACSYHLRQLARFGFVVEAGSGKGRARPWRATTRSLDWDEPEADPEESAAAESAAVRAAADELSRVWLDRQLGLLRRARARSDELPGQWRQAQFEMLSLPWLTPAELVELRSAWTELIMRFADRTEHPEARPADARPVRLLAFGHLDRGAEP